MQARVDDHSQKQRNILTSSLHLQLFRNFFMPEANFELVF